MKTPQYISRTLAAGGFASVAIPGNYLIVASISASSFAIGLDGETPEQVIAGGRIYVRRGFRQQRIQNTGAVAGTIIIVVSEDAYDLADAANAAVLAAMAASLGAIQVQLEIPDTPTLIARQAVPVVGGAGVHLVTAAAGNRRVFVQADDTNAGYVYLNFVDPATVVNRFTKLASGDVWQETFAGDVWANSDAGTEMVSGYVLKIA